jgi:hypothetical protein
MKEHLNTTLSLCAALLLTASTGCKTAVRENIISTINTGVGVTLAENPQTQLYEAKVGYIRSQFYSIPTSKTVLEEKEPGEITVSRSHDGQTNTVTGTSIYSPLTEIAADRTPEVVSGIRMDSGIQHLFLGVDISESFAVGKEAVNSPAAIAMYVAGAKNPNVAKAASDAVKATPTKQDLENARIVERDRMQRAAEVLDEAADKIFSAPPEGSPNRLEITRRILDGVDLGTRSQSERDQEIEVIARSTTRKAVRAELDPLVNSVNQIKQNLQKVP